MRPLPQGNKKSETLHHYIVCRGDLKQPGHAFAQVSHASSESCEGPLPSGTYTYVLEARDEDHLDRIAARLWEMEIPHTVIREPDAPYDGQATAIGIWPVTDRTMVRKATSDLPLYGKRWVMK